MPALLAVITVAAPACTDKPTTPSTESGTSDPTSTDSTDSSDGTATATPTSTGSSGTDTGSTTGGVPTCAPLPRPACEAEKGCYWFPDLGECIVDCAMIKDQATCQMQEYCSWFDGTCDVVIA